MASPAEVANDLIALGVTLDGRVPRQNIQSIRRGARVIQELAAPPDPEHMAALLFFLVGAEADGLMFQGRRASEALAAAARLLRIDAAQLEDIRRAAAL